MPLPGNGVVSLTIGSVEPRVSFRATSRGNIERLGDASSIISDRTILPFI